MGKTGTFEVSLSLVSPAEIHKLNLSYRKIDAPTDVLTFAYREADFNPNDPVTDLGSILICPAIAKKQAKGFHHPFEREMAFLFIHGLLHIFGYDHHAGKKDADIMFALQNKILDTLPYDFYTNIRRLKKELLLAQQGSLDTYSHFRVGAVVVTKDGKYHRGFNIENSSYPATVCAERVALFSTYAAGYTKDDIASLGCITDASTVGTCCGVCRQVMSELMDLSCPVYIYNKDESKSLVSTVGDLLPHSFGKDDLLS
ncbi:MAG: rRNA maturation RNase YbeY [Bacilli bacterium]|nr:rRNA maturation RNase YbeY [Bacilli bacterium]